MKASIIKQVAEEYPVMHTVIDGLSFLRKIHTIYKCLGCKIKNGQVGREIIELVAKENEVEWCYVVNYITAIIKKSEPRLFDTHLDSVDWEEVCECCGGTIREILKQAKVRTAYKELLYLVAHNEGLDIENLLAEPILNTYGWDNIVKELVVKYEEFLRMDAEEDEGYEDIDDFENIENIEDSEDVEDNENDVPECQEEQTETTDTTIGSEDVDDAKFMELLNNPIYCEVPSERQAA